MRKSVALNGTSKFTTVFTGVRLNQLRLEALYEVYKIPMFVVLKVAEFVFIRSICCQKSHFQISLIQI
jgi:hypothetical protein